jgi:hypothetical protein
MGQYLVFGVEFTEYWSPVQTAAESAAAEWIQATPRRGESV